MEKTEWHPAFCAAMRLELRDNETAEYYTCLYLLSDTRSGFLCACRLIARKGFITVWEQCHGTVSYASKVYQAQIPPGSVHGIPQATKMSCLRSTILHCSSAAGNRRPGGTFCFLPHSCGWFHPHTCQNPKGCFLGLWCRKKAPGCHSRSWQA